jgi:hypothetical protein
MSQLRLTHNHDHKIDITQYKIRKKSMRTNFQKIKY